MLRVRSNAAACAVLVALAFTWALAGDDAKKPVRHVPGVVYEVFHGEPFRIGGRRVREVHVPSRALAFYVDAGELRVFRPKPRRYELPGGLVVEYPGQVRSRLVPKPFPETETRRVGETRLRAEDVESLASLLREKTRLRALADSYLAPGGAHQPVVAHDSGNEAAAEFLAKLLDGAGILWAGAAKEGVETIGVPAARAEEARRILLDALGDPEWDARLDYRVIDRMGNVTWEVTRTSVPPAPPGADVLEHLARFTGSMEVGGRRPKYGDYDLERAEKTLEGRLLRPWTVKALMKHYAESSDPHPGHSDWEARAALIYLLAASRRPEALPLVGDALHDESLDVYVAATMGILQYWYEGPVPGDDNLEGMVPRARKWWSERKDKAKRR
jgi:hypothetical protein